MDGSKRRRHRERDWQRDIERDGDRQTVEFNDSR